MENKKEPLMSVKEWFSENTDKIPTAEERILITKYAKYYTQWHLNNAKEFVSDEAKVHQHIK